MGNEMASVVRVEHVVADYETWKRDGFDRDPLGREVSGVRRCRVLRAGDEPRLVAVELEFDRLAAAEAFVEALAAIWRGIGDRFGWHELPQARIFELAVVEEY